MIVKDTQEVARAAIVEEPFKPSQVGTSPMLDGIDVSQMPPLLGYVSTTPKPTSQVLLVSNQVDPILSEWQYRAGARGGLDLGRQEPLGSGLADLAGVQPVLVAGGEADDPDAGGPESPGPDHAAGLDRQVTVDSVSDDKSYQNFLKTSATVVDPSNAQSR